MGSFQTGNGEQGSYRVSQALRSAWRIEEKIDGFLREQRPESEKNAGPRITKKDWADWKD